MESFENIIKGQDLEAFKDLFNKESKLIFVDLPNFYINEYTGDITQDLEKYIITCPWLVSSDKIKDFKYDIIYVYSITKKDDSNFLNVRLAGHNFPTKQTVSFNVCRKVLQDFNDLANKMVINKSKFIESILKDFVKSNKGLF